MKMRFARRRGLSQVVGSLFMLAIVVPLGVVILSNGMGQAANFNQKLVMNSEKNIIAVQEDIVFEHIRFVPSTSEVVISVRNIGSIDTSINKISIVKMDTQELVLSESNLAPYLPLKDSGDISVNAILSSGKWDDVNYKNSDYKISIVTSRGNFFDTVARPFNT